MKRALAILFALTVAAAPSLADKACVEVRFTPGAPRMQMVVWLEDDQGTVIDTPFITRTTGQFGLANRPGHALLKTAFGWPYGRREMVAPIWAHRRNHHYPKVMMGGVCGSSPMSTCPNQPECVTCEPIVNQFTGGCCCGDCNDNTIAYHSKVSSGEPFYCPPDSGPDAISCASPFTGAKGAYATDGSFSLYPPRADLSSITPSVDSKDVLDFAKQNDLVAVSAATPPAMMPLNPPVQWAPDALPPGDYVAWIEISEESDFNDQHRYDNLADQQSAWAFEGHPFLGQPSVAWSVPFHWDGATSTSATTRTYAGYGDFDGATGTLHPPDGTITDSPGSGAGRLLDTVEGADTFRAKVLVGHATDVAPDPVPAITLTPDQTTVTVSFVAPSTGAPASRYAIRYRPGTQPITDAEFDSLNAGPNAVGKPGETVTAVITPLDRATKYVVAVRAVAPCGPASTSVWAATETLQAKFTTLHGCFVATAAWGSPLEAHVSSLRAFRDRHLLTNPAGRLATAIYYALSPPLANAIAADETLRALARKALQPIVALVTR